MDLRKCLTVLCPCLLVCFFASQSLAKLTIHPSISLQEEYNDNLFLDNEDEEEDWITTISPGIELEFDTRYVDLSLGASLDLKAYLNHSELNNFSGSLEDAQRFELSTVFFSGHPFTLSISDTISRENVDTRNISDDDNDVVNKTTVHRLMVNPAYRFPFSSSLSLVLGYTYDRADYFSSEGDDIQNHSGRLSLIKALSSNTEISANYTFTRHLPERSEEYDEQSYTLGLNQQLGPRTDIYLEGGYSIVEYDSGLSEDSTTWLVDVTHQLTAPLTLSFGFSQGFDVSATAGATKTQDATFTVAYQKQSLTASIDLFWNQEDYVLESRTDESYGSRFNLSVPLSRALTSHYYAQYETSQYDDVDDLDDQEVDNYSLGASLGFDYRRFNTSLGYRFRLNDSDNNDNDYTNNTVTLSVSARF